MLDNVIVILSLMPLAVPALNAKKVNGKTKNGMYCPCDVMMPFAKVDDEFVS